jgi:Tfp pilus assembly protein PilF
MIAEWLTEFSPSDPRTHYLSASVFEKTFNADDLSRAVYEYEMATALSPYNYAMWMSLGRARSLVGDSEGSFKAYRKALHLAPNYSGVQWIYGNALLREGETDAGLSMIAIAAAADPQYAKPAIATALQTFDGNIGDVRRIMGDTAEVNAGLAGVLSTTERVDESFEAWGRLSLENRRTAYKSLGETLRNRMIERKRFRLAASIHADITSAEAPAVSKVINGGFEDNVTLGNAGIFHWRISDGTHPQVGLSDSIKRSGQYSMLLMFNSFEVSGLRSIDQTVAVEPDAEYELEIFFRSDLRTDAALRWEVADAASLQKIAESEPIVETADWTPLRIRFRSPGASDGIQIRLVRLGCSGLACPMSGRLWFDDIALRRL